MHQAKRTIQKILIGYFIVQINHIKSLINIIYSQDQTEEEREKSVEVKQWLIGLYHSNKDLKYNIEYLGFQMKAEFFNHLFKGLECRECSYLFNKASYGLNWKNISYLEMVNISSGRILVSNSGYITKLGHVFRSVTLFSVAPVSASISCLRQKSSGSYDFGTPLENYIGCTSLLVTMPATCVTFPIGIVGMAMMVASSVITVPLALVLDHKNHAREYHSEPDKASFCQSPVVSYV